MNYCKNCGAKVRPASVNKYMCKKCESIFYVNPKSAVSILIITNDNKILLGRRALEPNKQKLDCVGGFVDVGENFEDCAYRELFEETGLNKNDIGRLSYFGSTYDPYPWQNRIVPVTSVYFVTLLKSRVVPEASDDIESFEILSLDSICKVDLAWSGLWEMIVKLKNIQDLQGTLNVSTQI